MEPHDRKQLRLNDYDYSQAGHYFVTICAFNRKNMFGSLVEADSISTFPKILLNVTGIMIESIYLELAKIFNRIKLHEYVIMPNHFHGIIETTNRDDILERADMESAPTGRYGIGPYGITRNHTNIGAGRYGIGPYG